MDLIELTWTGGRPTPGFLGRPEYVLTLCYTCCRTVLDRRRLAGWESAWAAVGPRWTSHR
jgi:hypothetical protein